jgi:hypothetical protein
MDSFKEDHSEPVFIGSFVTAGEAEIAVAHLRANDIEAVIVGSVETDGLPIQGEPGALLEVRHADAAEARELLGITE